jgi:hypothetical protein
MIARASWTNGREIVTGIWEYACFAHYVAVALDSGEMIAIKGDTPEWGDWRLL